MNNRPFSSPVSLIGSNFTPISWEALEAKLIESPLASEKEEWSTDKENVTESEKGFLKEIEELPPLDNTIGPWGRGGIQTPTRSQ